MSENDVEFSSEDEAVGSDLRVASFSQAVLWGTDWTVETVLAQLQRGNIDLSPRFQRRDAWSRPAKSRFVESIILGLPVPQVVLAELPEQRGRYIILDGKQRLLSLMQFSGYADGEMNRFRLVGLDVRDDLAGKRFADLENEVGLRSDFDAFLTHTIRTIVIRNWPSLSFLHVVFQRLNTGSLKLSAQELRQALAPGPFTDFVDDVTMSSESIWRILSNDMPDARMRDVELLVRALSFKLKLNDFAGRMKEFLDDCCIFFNKNWEMYDKVIYDNINRFFEGVAALGSIFGEKSIARKRNSKLFNRSIFDTLIYYAMDRNVSAAMLNAPDAVRKAYEALLDVEAFKAAIESDTAGIPHTAIRFRIWGQMLAEAIGEEVRIPQLAENQDRQLRFLT
ncbi:MAG: DUF262 domain-containing protein [Beijerinckiaceae bacterium]|nr:DUF262 domain-containing protein [Beijerinckiaceae bacterium]MCZ8300597.1 DUF262 domain-containing protein [Beijerinckiaceae bacterium]